MKPLIYHFLKGVIFAFSRTWRSVCQGSRKPLEDLDFLRAANGARLLIVFTAWAFLRMLRCGGLCVISQSFEQWCLREEDYDRLPLRSPAHRRDRRHLDHRYAWKLFCSNLRDVSKQMLFLSRPARLQSMQSFSLLHFGVISWCLSGGVWARSGASRACVSSLCCLRSV